MKVYKKETVQHINATIDECWNFFSSPRNLERITPNDMAFVITDYDNRPMYAGQIIQYNVKPISGIKLRWMTIITVVKENEYFIDEQRFGPYTLWHHKHFFEKVDGGVKMTDVVHYALPLGWLGQLMNFLVVNTKLNKIFEYRVEAVNQIFNSTR